MIRFARFDTPLGAMIAAANDDGLVAVDFTDARHAPRPTAGWTEAPHHASLTPCLDQLRHYFAGHQQRFELALAPRGTPFQHRVWQEIAAVPYGSTLAYGLLANRAGTPGAARAAGAATGRNPLAIIVPCHRIVGANGRLTGYASGLERKAQLLALERGARPL